MHLIELLGDVDLVESCFAPFGDSVSVGARSVHDMQRTYHRLRNHFGRTQFYSYVKWVMWNLVSVCWEPVSVQDRCMVCAEHAIGSEVVLDEPDGTPRRCGSC